MNSESLTQIADLGHLEQYGMGADDVEAVLDELPEYAVIENKGQLAESSDYPFDSEGALDADEVPEPRGREGESSLGIGYSDFEVLYAGMAGERDFNLDAQMLDVPEENTEEALGALFGTSYALFRYEVMEGGLPADHSTFRQDIDTQEEKEKFLEEGAVEIQGEIMGPWGYDHDLMNEVMDAQQALESYHTTADQLV
ncbi:hypothetical protein ACK3SF_04205 [Candidatus Nanosalina sp. VS9-1]|uniref:hypothetical protein n=1 Tax=Candidatus Nanosalina sp. VS9-1 TaxID=3388566 RepID=UPI0039DFC89F